MRLESLLSGFARRRPAHPALVCGSVRLSYADLDDRVARFAGGLVTAGVRPGDRVLLYLPNGIEFVVALYGTFAAGAIAVTVNTRLTAGEVRFMAVDAEPRVVVFEAASRDAIADATQGLDTRRVVVGATLAGEDSFDALASAPRRNLPDLSADDDDALIMYTSGTTGRPKGAIITHANMVVQNTFLHAREWHLTEDDRLLVVTPLAHRAGIARLFNALGLGATLVILPRFDPAATLQAIATERITMTGLVPTALRMMLPLLRADPGRCATLRCLNVSTEAFPVDLKEALLALLPDVRIHSLFGSTEVLATNLSHAEQFTHPETVGRALPGVDLRLVDDAGNEVGTGEAGELLVRSGVPGRWATFRGYFRRPDDTAATIRDGWVHTGDMARMDADGYLTIVDRKKDMVLSGGYNIYSKEVEQVLVRHPRVADAAVIGIPDPVYGEAVAAFIESADPPSRSDLLELCRTHLAGYKKPKFIAFVQALPRNSTGKVLKNDLRERARAMTPADWGA